MGEEVFYRVKLAECGEMRREIALFCLRRGFSLKKVLVIEGGSLLISLLLVAVMGEIEILPALAFTLTNFCIHLWVVWWWTFAMTVGARWPKGMEMDTENQIWFFTNGFREKCYGAVQELPYDGIKRVNESAHSFWVEYQNNAAFILLKKNFVEGDPSSFKKFLANPVQKPGYARAATDAERNPVHTQPLFQAGSVLDQEVCVRNGALEQGWAMENIGALNFWGDYVGRTLMILPFMTLAAWIPLIRNDDQIVRGIMFSLLLMVVGVFLISGVGAWKKRGVNYAVYSRSAMQQYQMAVKKGMSLEPVSCSFYEESFEVTRRREHYIYGYSHVTRMYQAEWHLVLLVGNTAISRALPLDKRGLGEDCGRLMEFLGKKTGQDWKNSPM